MDDFIHIIGISSNEGRHVSKDVTSNTPLQALPPTCLHTHISIDKVCMCVYTYVYVCVCVFSHSFTLLFTNVYRVGVCEYIEHTYI